MQQTQIGFLIYPDVIQLDVTAAYQVLAFPPQTSLHLIAKTTAPLKSNEGLILQPTVTLDDCPPLDVICVPGGGLGQLKVIQDPDCLDFLRHQSTTSQYVTSVCTGSLILAAAGLLQGYRATTHYLFRDQLALLGVEVVPERVVIDRNRVTGAGVTSGLDFGLTLLSLLYGETTAQMAQLMMEYSPKPPFAGTPETAAPEAVAALMQAGQPLMEAFLKQTQATAIQLKQAT
ncbi:DJ-1/PfpI family protein [Acaryochloris thomasi]|nr:DJ-1/PfpI family protein [Acaryochloris thomasi]